MTIDAFPTLQEPQPPPDEEPRPGPLAIAFPSRTSGKGHIVGIVDHPKDLILTCTCRAYLRVLQTNGEFHGCWAMDEVRRMLGAPR